MSPARASAPVPGAAVLAALAALVVACGPGGTREAGGDAATEDDAVHAEIVTELEAYYADFSARDWNAFSDHFWPGATITTVWQPPGSDSARVDVSTIPAFVARAPEGPGSREIFEERMTDVAVTVEGGLAQAWTRYEARFGDPGAVMEWQGTDAFTLMRHGGRWRIVSLAFAGDG